MKRFIIVFSAFLLTITWIRWPNKVYAIDEPNLILNPSVEISNPQNPSLPLHWQRGSMWGDRIARYDYTYQGKDSSRALLVEILGGTSGDAKWVFDPIEVKPNTRYYFTDHYRSNVASEVIVQLEKKDGSYGYQSLRTLPSTSNVWKFLTLTFITDEQTKRLTVFHLINQTGRLETDNYRLSSQEVDNLFVNGGVNFADPNNSSEPFSWHRGSWGEHWSSFNYLERGRTGRGLKVTISNYKSGDAKWFSNPINVEGGKKYQFSDYYVSNVPTRVVAWIIKNDGTHQFMSLKRAEAANRWTEYLDTLILPSDVVAASFFHLIERNGYLMTDDYSLREIGIEGLNRPLITLTFDDSWESNHQSILPLLNQYNYKITQYICTRDMDYKSVDQLKKYLSNGHEFGSHSLTHQDLTTTDLPTIEKELRDSKVILENTFNVPITSFATPYGAYDNRVMTLIKKYYRSHRSVDVGYIGRSGSEFNAYNIKVQNLKNNTTENQFRDWVETARRNKLWLVLVYHRVDNLGGEYSNTPQQFETHLNIIKNSQVPVLTLSQALEEVRSQIR